MKKLALLLLIITGCATADPSILDVQHKVLASKYVERGVHYFQFFDGTVMVVDQKTFRQFEERQTVKLTWRKKNV